MLGVLEWEVLVLVSNIIVNLSLLHKMVFNYVVTFVLWNNNISSNKDKTIKLYVEGGVCLI